MTTITLTLTMPDELAAQAEEDGLLSSPALLQMIRREIAHRRVDRLFQAADRLAALGELPLTDEEIAAEIDAARRQRRASDASGS